MPYRIVRHPDVEQDLEDILVLILEYAGPRIAAQKLEQLETTIASLSVTPHVGSVRDEIAEGVRAIPSVRKGVITFTVDDDAKIVRILAITYAGADWIGRLHKRG